VRMVSNTMLYKYIPKNLFDSVPDFAPGLDHAEVANDASQAANLYLFIGNT